MGIKFDESPFEQFPQFFFSLIFFAPVFLMEQSFDAPKAMGFNFVILEFSQVASKIIAHSGSS